MFVQHNLYTDTWHQINLTLFFHCLVLIVQCDYDIWMNKDVLLAHLSHFRDFLSPYMHLRSLDNSLFRPERHPIAH